MNPLSLIANLMLCKVTNWDSDSSQFPSQEERKKAPSIADANVCTSVRLDTEDRHAVLLDLDVPAALVPSSTPGHSHLYVDVSVPTETYFRLLDVLAEAGVIETGYANVSKHRGGTSLRLPWIKKPDTSSQEPPL